MDKFLKILIGATIIILIIGGYFLLINKSTMQFNFNCWESGGKWKSGYIGPAGSSDGYCICPSGKTIVSSIIDDKCITLSQAGKVCCHWTRPQIYGGGEIYEITSDCDEREREDSLISTEIVNDNLCGG